MNRLLSRFRAALGGRRRLSLKVAVAVVMRVVGAGAGIALTVVIARTLDAAEAGYFFLALSLVTLLVPVTTLGLPTALLRFVGAAAGANDWGRILSVTALAWRWGLSAGLSGVALLWLAAPMLATAVYDKPALAPVLSAIALSCLFLALGLLCSRQLQAVGETAKSIFVLSIGVPLIVALLVLLLPVTQASTVASLHVGAALLTLLIGVAWWYRRLPAGNRSDFKATTLWNSSAPLWVVQMMAVLSQSAGLVIGGIWLDAAEIAMLAVAQRTAGLVSFVLIALNLVVAPRIASLFEQNKLDRLRRLSRRAVAGMLLLSTPIVLSLLTFGREILSMFGPGFSAAVPILAILTLAQFVNAVTGSVGSLLMMTGHERDMRNIVLMSGPSAVGFALVLTPLFGVTGAAIASALGIVLQNLGASWMVRRRLGFNTLHFWKR